MKTKHTTLYIVALLASLMMTSCTNDLPVDPNAEKDVLVMNGYIAADSTNNTIKLFLTGNQHPIDIKDAIVTINVNGEFKETAKTQTNTIFTPEGETTEPTNTYLIHTPVKVGDVVRIDAQTADGKYHAWVEETVPQPMEAVEKIDTSTVANPFPSDYTSYTKLTRFNITIKDRPNENNFYQLVIDESLTYYTYSSYNDIFYTYPSTLTGYTGRNDVVLTDGNPSSGSEDDDGIISYTQGVENRYGVFDDKRFTNSSYTMTVYNNSCYYIKQPNYTIDAYIRLRSINETAFHYFKALNLYKSDNYDETLSGSMKFPSNVHDGTGIIVFSSETNKVIRLSNARLDEVKKQDGNYYGRANSVGVLPKGK